MSVTVKHPFVSAVLDSADTSLVRPSNWNADHTIIGLGTAAEKDVGVANGVASLDAGGKVPVSELPAAVLGALSYQGTWNASTNTPTLASGVGVKGYYYVVSVAGSTNLDGVSDWVVGDWAVFNGTAWQKVDNTDAVTSVNGQTGTVVLTAADVGAQPAGTYVTSVGATSPVTSTGGTTPTIAMAAANTSTDGYLTSTDWNTFNSKGSGTVTSVAATASTGISVSGSPITTSGTLTITNTAPDQTVSLTAGTGISTTGTYPNFTITNTAPSSGGTVTSVTGTAPVVSSGGNTPAISMAAATTSVNGYLTSTDWNTFNNKTSNTGTVTSVGGTGTVNGITLTGTVTTSGNLTLGGTLSGVSLTSQVSGTLPVANGGTGTATAFTAGSVVFAGASGVYSQDNASLFFDNTNDRLGIGTSSPAQKLTIANGAVKVSKGYSYLWDDSNLEIRAEDSPAWLAVANTMTFKSYSGAFVFQNSNGAASIMTVRADNTNVGIGTTTPQAKLSVSNGGAAGFEFFANYPGGGVGTYIQSYNRSSPGYVSTAYDAADHSFRISGTEKMRLDSSGNLLVGTAVPYATACFVNTVGGAAIYSATGAVNADCFSFNSVSTSATVYGIGMYSNASAANTAYLFRGFHSTSTFCFGIAGSGNVTNTNNSYGAISDIKLKENIIDATPKLNKLNQVRVVNYNFIGDTQKQLGVVAQELEHIFPSLVEESVDRDKEGKDLGTTTKSVKYSVFVPMLIKAIQEQQALIQDLTTRLTAIEGN